MTSVADHLAMASTSYEQGLDRPWRSYDDEPASPSTPNESKSLRKMFSSKLGLRGSSDKSPGSDYRADDNTDHGSPGGREQPVSNTTMFHQVYGSPGGREQPVSSNIVSEQEISRFNDKGNDFIQRNEYDAALRMYSEALKLLRNTTIVMDAPLNGKSSTGSNNKVQFMNPDMRRFRTARCLVNVGVVHLRRGEHNDALSTLEMSLRHSKLVTDGKHYYRACEVTADAIENIGLILFKQGKYDDSRAMYTEALEARRKCVRLMDKLHGHWRPNRSKEEIRMYKEERNVCLLETSVTLFYLSLLNEKQGLFDVAVETCEEAILVRREVIPDVNADSNSISLFSTIGRLYCHEDVKRYKEALWYFHEVHRMKCINGRNNLDVVPSLNHIASIYNTLGDYEKSITISDRAIEIVRTNGGELTKEACIAYINRGDSHTHIQDNDLAITSYETALDSQRKCLEDNDMMNASVYEKLAECYFLTNDIKKAVSSLEKSIKVMKLAKGSDNVKLANGYSKLGLYYTLGGDSDRAIKCHTRALRIYKHHDNKPMAATEHNKIAGILKVSGEKQKAREHYLVALWMARESQMPSSDPIVADTIMNVAAYQDSEQDKEHVEEW